MIAAQWIVGLTYLRLLIGAATTFRKSSNRHTSFLLALTFLALYWQTRSVPLYEPMAIPAAVLIVAALALFQWATHSIRGLHFSYLGDDDIPQFVFQGGPFAYIRNPFYASYIITNVAVAMAFPSWISGAAALASIVILTVAAVYEERKFSRSPLAEEYRTYAERTGRFTPKSHRTA